MNPLAFYVFMDMALPYKNKFKKTGTNVVKVFTEAISSGHEYLQNPPSDDFYAEIKDLGLLDDDEF